eukprot:21828_5
MEAGLGSPSGEPGGECALPAPPWPPPSCCTRRLASEFSENLRASRSLLTTSALSTHPSALPPRLTSSSFIALTLMVVTSC